MTPAKNPRKTTAEAATRVEKGSEAEEKAGGVETRTPAEAGNLVAGREDSGVLF